MNVNIDSSLIESAVTAAIVNSAIGKHIEKAVDELLQKGYNSPISTAVERVILDTAVKIVSEEYQDKIKEAVRATLTDDLVNEVTRKMFDYMMKERYR
jgi:hypothetical protein